MGVFDQQTCHLVLDELSVVHYIVNLLYPIEGSENRYEQSKTNERSQNGSQVQQNSNQRLTRNAAKVAGTKIKVLSD